MPLYPATHSFPSFVPLHTHPNFLRAFLPPPYPLDTRLGPSLNERLSWWPHFCLVPFFGRASELTHCGGPLSAYLLYLPKPAFWLAYTSTFFFLFHFFALARLFMFFFGLDSIFTFPCPAPRPCCFFCRSRALSLVPSIYVYSLASS